jgi:hypothetical protein
MKIAVCGTSCIGKSTYIKDFLKQWTMFETPNTSYRDILKEKSLPHSGSGTEESQKIILDYLVEQAIQSSKKDFTILDRCVLDNFVYTSWLFLNGKISEKFLEESRILTRETLKLYDVLFFIPLTKVAPVKIVEDELRDTDPQYRQEIDNIFKVYIESYRKSEGKIFPSEDCPAVIEIFGNPKERIKMTELYITNEGKPYGEDQSLLSGL